MVISYPTNKPSKLTVRQNSANPYLTLTMKVTPVEKTDGRRSKDLVASS